MSPFNVNRETKVISAILFITALSLVGARYLDRQSFVDWSDVEKIAEYDREAGIGDSIEIRYYLVNDRPYAIKVKPELNYYSAIYYSSDPDKRTVPSSGERPDEPYVKIPANSKEEIHSVSYVVERAGRLIIEFYRFPDVQIDILPEYSYVMKLNSEPHLVRGGNCYYTIDITMLNNGVSDINVKLENVRICDIRYINVTVDERGYDIVPDYTEYVLVPVNGTQSIRYVTGEVVYGSIFYVRIEFTLHVYELDKIEIVSTWLHRKGITS